MVLFYFRFAEYTQITKPQLANSRERYALRLDVKLAPD